MKLLIVAIGCLCMSSACFINIDVFKTALGTAMCLNLLWSVVVEMWDDLKGRNRD